MLRKLSFAIRGERFYDALKGERFNDRYKKLVNTAFEMNNLKIDWKYKDVGTEII